jgi:hypothetical protein
MDLLGVARGEVARVWVFLVPLPLLIAVYRLEPVGTTARRRGFVFGVLIALLSLQLFVTNIFVRYINTDLTDPPDPPPQAVLDGGWTPRQATWEEGITLQAVQLPDEVRVDGPNEIGPIEIGAVWTTSRRIHKPYTVFVHVFDEAGQLVAQRDTLHLDRGWPTTCWRPGESFEDRYEMVPVGPIEPGLHRVEIGHYWLPTGERLPVSGQSARQTVDVGTFEVKAAP